jgi:putative transposase
MRRFKSARHLQRFASVHDQVANLFMRFRYHTDAKAKAGVTHPGLRGLGERGVRSDAGALRSLS